MVQESPVPPKSLDSVCVASCLSPRRNFQFLEQVPAWWVLLGRTRTQKPDYDIAIYLSAECSAQQLISFSICLPVVIFADSKRSVRLSAPVC